MDERKRVMATAILNKIKSSRRKRRNLTHLALILIMKRTLILKALLLTSLLAINLSHNVGVVGRPRRCIRNMGWFDTLWTKYSQKRFKQTLRVTKHTFNYILDNIRQDISKKDFVCEIPISCEERLAIALYKFGRGDYNQTLSEMTGRGESTIRAICNEVSCAIVSNLWDKHVRFPQTEGEISKAMNEMESLWQCTCAYAAVDGCHIPCKCPPGGAESRKDYFNFKNFYSIILMGIVDARCRFLWASSGLPGSVHDAMIFRSTELYKKLNDGDVFPDMYKEIGGVKIPPMILGDSAFTHHTWLQKPYSHAVLSEEQSYFNYRLSRARMVVECAYGQLKGRWRILHRKCESHPETLNQVILACVVLHNICIDRSDVISPNCDLNLDGQAPRTRENLRDVLVMCEGKGINDSSKGALKVRDALKSEFWKEYQESDPNSPN